MRGCANLIFHRAGTGKEQFSGFSRQASGFKRTNQKGHKGIWELNFLGGRFCVGSGSWNQAGWQ